MPLDPAGHDTRVDSPQRADGFDGARQISGLPMCRPDRSDLHPKHPATARVMKTLGDRWFEAGVLESGLGEQLGRGARRSFVD